jgi:uroporphyrinogen-III decarboxylase
MTAREGTPEECELAAKSALEIARGKARVALTVANEVHPGTPLENMRAIIEAVRAWGVSAN